MEQLYTLISITAALTNGLEAPNPYGSNNYRRTLPRGINVHAEYQRIQNKQSSLSKWERDEVIRLYAMEKTKVQNMHEDSKKHNTPTDANNVLADSARPERRKTNFDGRKAMIVGIHPHKGATATCQGFEVTNVGPGLVFKNENTYEEFFIFKPENVMWMS